MKSFKCAGEIFRWKLPEDQETYDGSGQEKLVYETCEICDAYIYLESFEEAKCLKGHSFGKSLFETISSATDIYSSPMQSNVPCHTKPWNIKVLSNLR